MKASISGVFAPRLFSCLKDYDKDKFAKDLMAGIIVGIVAIPLAIAFGIASGVTPEKGIITAIVAGFIISLLGGTKVQIGGPTGAFIVIIYGIVTNPNYGIAGLTVATLLAGVLMLLMGVFKLGTIIKFIPYPIIIGFTAGIAVTIFTTQMGDVFGLKEAVLDKQGLIVYGDDGNPLMMPLKTPGDFIGKWIAYSQHMDSFNVWNFTMAIASILIIIFSPKCFKKIPGLNKIPGSLYAIIFITLIVLVMKQWMGIDTIDTIGDRFHIQSKLPEMVVPSITFKMVQDLMPIAFTIAILGAIESLLSAAVADGVIGDRHNSNTELIAQGIANMITPLFGGIPATGAIARTMTNINNGGRTPIAGIIHAVVLLLILLVLMPYAEYIPMACLAGVLVIVAYNMSGWRTFVSLAKNPKSDFAVLIVTFALTVIFDLTVAIEIGLLLAIVLFLKRTNEASVIRAFKDEIDPGENLDITLHEEKLTIPTGVEVYEIDGPYFFGIANKFDEIMKEVGDKPKVRVIRMRKVPFIDSTGIHNLETLCLQSKKEGIHVVLSGVNKHVHSTLEKAGFEKVVGSENICSNINEALQKSSEYVSNDKK